MKNKDSKRRKNVFSLNRTCYLSSDGKYYCYEYWDPDAKRMATKKLEVGKDLSLEWAHILDASDYEMNLNEQYHDELRDSMFDARVTSYEANLDNEEAVNPWSTLVDQWSNVEDATYAEKELRNFYIVQVYYIINEYCTEVLNNSFYEHFSKCTQHEEMHHAEAEQTGKMLSLAEIR